MSEQERIEEFVKLMEMCVMRRVYPLAGKVGVYATIDMQPLELVSEPRAIKEWREHNRARAMLAICQSRIGLARFASYFTRFNEPLACWVANEVRAIHRQCPDVSRN